MREVSCSIIIPVYNNAGVLNETLKALKHQVLDREKTEVFVIDNGSDDNSKEIAKSFSFVTLLIEEEHLGSPYSARNRGIEKANGEIIILLDAKCTPSENWLSEGLRDLKRFNADLIGGKVVFSFSNPPKAGEIWDSLMNVQMERSIKERGVAKGGNLFIRRGVFNGIGKFPEGIRSGADVSWTQKATKNSFKLAYSENAFVFYPARGFAELVKKQWRVAKGQPEIWVENGKDFGVYYLIRKLLGTIILAPIYSAVKRRLAKSAYEVQSGWLLLKVEIVNYTVNVVMRIGNLYGYFKVWLKHFIKN